MTVERVHSDKTGKKVEKDDEMANVVLLARDYLYGMCKNVDSGASEFQQSVANIAADLDV
jgi:hypothetical protein